MTVTTYKDGNRRRFIRLELHEGVTAELRVIGIDQHPVESSPAKVLLMDISPRGFRFSTTLRFSSDSLWRVAILFRLEGFPLEVRGRIRHHVADYHWWQYGVEMDDNPLLRIFITRALNSRLIRSSPALARMHQSFSRSAERMDKRGQSGPASMNE